MVIALGYSSAMIRRNKRRGQQKRTRVVRWPGLCQAAKDLGYHRTHLYLVLTGQRRSLRTMRRFQEWQKERPK